MKQRWSYLKEVVFEVGQLGPGSNFRPAEVELHRTISSSEKVDCESLLQRPTEHLPDS